MVDVKAAAEFLDSKVGKVSWLTADWRSEIDTSKLNMSTTRNCILGQLNGSFTAACAELGIDYIDSNISDAFCSGTDEWIEYLKESTHMYTVGQSLWGIHNKMKYTVLATYTKGGVRYYVIDAENFSDEGSIWTEDKIKADWTTVKPKKYKKGDVIALKGTASGVHVLVGSNDYGIRIGSGGKFWGEFSNAPMDEYTRFEYEVIGNVTEVWAAGFKF